ncbi:hypothetical protein SAMN05216226_10549 [Halovenus aranensis]|uniref:RnhA operon protein n=1 Tax=Halovenus aranensis TaxID=890420 RepID=A0A1G8UPW5_9EURY|nr:rnhA operon protein [Halovenus aranensis]SDJ55833.1 hypothetical protein SAMN05216226_10549 [Halovenus aranensis]
MAENHSDSVDEATDEQPLPAEVVDQAEQLTRRAREAVDDNEATAYRERRAELLTEYDYRARIRNDDDDVLVLYPDEWLTDGVAQLEAIEDLDRGIERPLEGAGDAEQWRAIEEHNRDLADRVEAAHGEVHGENAHALADFMSNHYAKEIERATGEEVAEFREEYFPRNAWPSDEQQAAIDASLEYVFECAQTEPPAWREN